MSAQRMTHKHGAKRGIGVALILALLVAAIALMLNPSHVPAADVGELESVAVGTPLAIDPDATIDPDDACALGEQSETDSVQTAIEFDPPVSGTPVAEIEEEPEVDAAICETPDDAIATETPVSALSPAAALGETPTDGPTETATPQPESTVDAPASDPAMDGLPENEIANTPASDPFEGGLPAVVASATAIADPMVDGIPTTPVAALTGDPAMDGIPATEIDEAPLQDPMLAGSELTSQVDVIVTGVSVDGVITPGGKISYLFRITNPGPDDVVIDMVATTDLPEWSAIVAQPGSIDQMSGTQFLAAGDAIEVLVIVTAPIDASVGDHVVTSLTATIQN